MNEILSLAPQNVWKHFYSLTQVPRPSGHLAKVQSFLLEFGKNAGVEAFQDEAGNIIYRKPATPGMENRKTVILQAHMDMVPQKNKDTQHDFENDPIQVYVDGEWVKAKGTTLILIHSQHHPSWYLFLQNQLFRLLSEYPPQADICAFCKQPLSVLLSGFLHLPDCRP